MTRSAVFLSYNSRDRSQVNLALLLSATDRLAEAETAFERALAIQQARLDRIISMWGTHSAISHCCCSAPDAPPLAEAMMRRALEINDNERVYGVAHPEIATGLNNLAMLLANLGRPGEAEPLQRRALANRVARLMPENKLRAFHGYRVHRWSAGKPAVLVPTFCSGNSP